MNTIDNGPVLRLLLVEDSPWDARLLQEFLTEAGSFRFEMTHVERLQKALVALDEEQFDLLLLDLSLPDSQGIESLTCLHRYAPDVPIVVLTGLNDEAIAVEAVRQGAQDYLVKNHIDSKLLARAVRYAIERFRILEALRESEERYALAARAASDGLWDWNLRTNEIYYSPRWCTMLGYDEDSITSSPDEWFDRIHPDDRRALRQTIQDHLEGRTSQFECEYRIRRQDGQYRWMLSRGMALTDRTGTPYRLAGSQSDITERKQYEEQLLYDALHDPLTRLPNRVFFRERLKETLRQARERWDFTFAVLFLDLDRFKTINDSLGHLVGDELLKDIAKRLESCLAPQDIIARLGGDEFAILLRNIRAPSEAVNVAKHILEAMKRPFRAQGHEVFSTGSIGIALSSGEYSTPEEMLRDADTAMYRAKAEGPAHYQLFNATMHVRAVALWKLETDLRRAVERQEFRIYYQPIVSLKSGRLAGFEALVRWQHPERGLLYPIDFLSVAEETGLIATLDRWTIYHGAHQLKRWQEQRPQTPPLFLNVNLSASVLNQPGLPEYIEQVLAETGVAPYSLRLEITESVVMNDILNLPRTLAELHALHIQLCIDDFGTGYSSLSSLHYYPVDTLKIDGSFVRGLISDDGNPDIVRTIITLAHDLDLEVIAEGVETPRQYAQLQALNCELGQGALFSHAIDDRQSHLLIAQDPRWPAMA